PGSYVSRSYTILTAVGGVTGTFDALRTLGLPTDFGARLSYTGNTVLLGNRAQLVPEGGQPGGGPPIPGGQPIPGLPFPLADQPDPPTPLFTVNQLNVGHAIDNFFNNGGALPPAFVSLFNLTGNNLTTALDQLSGEPATGAQKVGFQLTNQFLDVMLDPFVDGRCGIGRTDYPPLGSPRDYDCETRPSALGFAPERETVPSRIALAYASVLREPRTPLPPVYEPRWTTWAGAYGGSNRTTGDLAIIGSHDLSARTVGGAAGLDYHYTPDTVLGFALAGGGTKWDLSQGLGGGKSDAFQAGVYGATKYGPAYLAAAFAFANHWMSTDRLAVGDHLTADFNAQSYGGRLEGGYRFATIYGGITPYAAIQAQSFHTPGYTDRRHPQRLCARLRLARRHRHAQRIGCAVRPGASRLPKRCVGFTWPSGLGARLGQRSNAGTAVPSAARRELRRQRRDPAAELRAGISGRGASPCQRRDAARQVRRRVRLTLIDLWRNGNVPIQVVRARPIGSPRLSALGHKRTGAILRLCPLYPRKRTSRASLGQTASAPVLPPSAG